MTHNYTFPGECGSFSLVFQEEIFEIEIGNIQWTVSTVAEAMLFMLSHSPSQKERSFHMFWRCCVFIPHTEQPATLLSLLNQRLPYLRFPTSPHTTPDRKDKQLLNWVATLFSFWFVAKTKVGNQFKGIHVGCLCLGKSGTQRKAFLHSQCIHQWGRQAQQKND